MSSCLAERLEAFDEPIRNALARYSELSDGRTTFDLDQARFLSLTPDKPNSARSQTQVMHLGETVADLFVILFAPYDGTGDESTFKITDVGDPAGYPLRTKVLPRSKAKIHSEVHLTITTQLEFQPSSDPIIYAGSLEMLWPKPRTKAGFKVAHLADLGQTAAEFSRIGNTGGSADPTVTYSAGYQKSADSEGSEVRFGDPHSVFNQFNAYQVCGFIALTPQMAELHPTMFDELNAKVPVLAQ